RPRGQTERPPLSGRSRRSRAGSAALVSRPVRTSVRSIAPVPQRNGASAASEKPDDHGIHGRSGEREPPPHEVEGLVGCTSRGGSSPLRRTEEGPADAGLSCPRTAAPLPYRSLRA